MSKIGFMATAVLLGALFSGSLSAAYTLFDTAKDSDWIVRGRFTALERTDTGDRLTFRIDSQIKGEFAAQEVVIEPVDAQNNDAALGQEAIVGLFERNGRYHAAWGHRGIYLSFEGIDACEDAIRGLLAVNDEYPEAVDAARWQEEPEVPSELLARWKGELVRHCGLQNSSAAHDAAKALFEHPTFKGCLTDDDLAALGELVPTTPPNSIERSYMILLIRNHPQVHPTFEQQVAMLENEKPGGIGVGRVAELMDALDIEGEVVPVLGEMLSARRYDGSAATSSVMKQNILHVFQAFGIGKRTKAALPYIHAVLAEETAKGPGLYDKGVVRFALIALRDTPDASNTSPVESFLGTDISDQSWELQRRALAAFANIDSEYTNSLIRTWFEKASEDGRRQFLYNLLEENKDRRSIVLIFNED